MGTWRGRITIGTIVLIIGLFAIGLTSPINAYAQQSSEELKWQLVFLTSNKFCGNYDYQSAIKYSEITSKYLNLYKIKNIQHASLCYSQLKYLQEYQAPNDLDLLVLVYDKNLGGEYLH